MRILHVTPGIDLFYLYHEIFITFSYQIIMRYLLDLVLDYDF